MQLTVTRVGDIRRQTEAIIKAGRQAKTTVVRRKTTTLKNALRRKVSAKLGTRMGNTIRDKTFPATGTSTNPRGQVASSAIYKRAGGLADLITVFRFGAVIHPIKGLFLAVGWRKFSGRGVTHSFRSSSEKRGFFGGLTGTKQLAFVKSVKILPRIADLDAEYTRVTASLEADIVKEYDRQLAKVAR